MVERVQLSPPEMPHLQAALRRLEEAGQILHPVIRAAEQPPLSYRALLHRHPRLHPQPGQPGRAAATQLPLVVA